MFKIKEGSSQINEYIKNGDIQFNNDNKVSYVNKEIEENSIMTRGANDGYTAVLSSYTYCSNYVWHWYGFDTDVNVKGSELLANEISNTQKIVAATGASVGVVSGGALAVPSVIVGGAVEVWLEGLKTSCLNGVTTEKGVYVEAWGAPSSAQIYDITTYY